MHHGSLISLEDVVNFYNEGGVLSKKARPPYLSEKIRALDLTPEEKSNLVLFMKTLNSEIIERNGNTNELFN